MSKVIRLKKGLDIKLIGASEKVLVNAPAAETYAVKPADFAGLTPKLLVQEGDAVKAGTPLFFDKYRPEVLFASPVSGRVSAIVRGEKRKLLEVVVTPDGQNASEEFPVEDADRLSRDRIIDLMLASGLWPMMIQRPYGIVADPKQTPKAVFVSGFNTAPLAPDADFILLNREEDFAFGMKMLGKLTTGLVNLGISENSSSKVFRKLPDVQVTEFSGPHPAGNVGIQIHHVSPVVKGDLVWTMDLQHVITLGKFFRTGKVDMTKIVNLAGSEVLKPKYYRLISGARIDSVTAGSIKKQEKDQAARYISGDVLTGRKVEETGHLGFYSNMISVIPEGHFYEMFGWAAPRFDKFSASRAYFSWLTPNRKYDLNTNLNGAHRPFVMSGQYEKVLPMDIYPVYLLKAILAGDIDKMENLGIYEVIEEDLALCEFVCTSKTEVQHILRQGIDQMIKELN